MHTTVPLETGMEPFPGFRLGRLLGHGGFGQVWEATGSNGTVVAMKFLSAQNSQDPQAEIRLLQAIRNLNHPNLIHVYQVWCHLGYIVIAMEVAEGNLAQFSEMYRREAEDYLPSEHVCLLLSQVAAALDFLNLQKHFLEDRAVTIQHCDVKPSNLMMFGDTVKLGDFGLAEVMTGPVKTRRPCGTPRFAAPEVFRNRLSRYSDQYSLAVTYCELRSGQNPFHYAALGLCARLRASAA